MRGGFRFLFFWKSVFLKHSSEHPRFFLQKEMLSKINCNKKTTKTTSPQKIDDIGEKVNGVGKSVEKKIDMISTYLIRS